jgi:hypothetical protein
MRARANSSPRQRKASSAGESTATSQLGRMVSMREIDSPNRSSAAVSFVACTRRVAMLPRSLQSISITESCRSSNSKRRHLAAARFRFAMRSRTKTRIPREQKGRALQPGIFLQKTPGTDRATESRRSKPHRSSSASRKHSRRGGQRRSDLAAASHARKSDQTISPDQLGW